MKETEVYVKTDEATNLALIEYSDDVWSRTSSYLKPTTGILLTKEELVKLIMDFTEKYSEGKGTKFLREKGLL